ncbi:MAG TPA: N-acetyl-gamma-glutamyl-phosphate reductase [Candidatus Dormibacteraeota bacterium]|nr:N-acetyl-gamma-glutamyl-phosphate reductase [Candidatus Dormibacteraeota bacterium]
MTLRVSVVAGAGYVGGELVRLLLGHPEVVLGQITSDSHPGRVIATVHPNLRHFPALRFAKPADLDICDVLIVADREPSLGRTLAELRQLAPLVIDCGPRLRFRDADTFRTWYGGAPESADALATAVYGLPELHRSQLRGATLVSGAGCSAVASILSLLPLVRAGWPVLGPAVIEARFGSSAAGSRPEAASHHPERSGAVRVFAPAEHRHSAEVVQALGWPAEAVSYSAVAIEMVRGISVSTHCLLERPLSDRDLWAAFRDVYRREPFLRIASQRSGLHRFPDPRWTLGTNFCDVGFALDRSGRRLTLMAALDNLGKGAAGNVIQAMNCALGMDESLGLGFPGLHPI